MIKNILGIIFMFIFVACEGQGDFEPNNLITIEEDNAAEEERARLTAPPVIDSFIVTEDSIFDVGEIITVVAQLSKRTKIVSGTTPRIQMNIGGITRYANYRSGSESRDFRFVFEYTVQAGDLDHDGIDLVSPWQLNGSVIEDYAGKAANLVFTAPDLSGRKVDTANITATFAEGIYTTVAGVNLNVVTASGSTFYIGSTCLGGGSDIASGAVVPYTLPSLNANNITYIAAGNGSGGYSQCFSLSIIHDNQGPNTVTAASVARNSSDIESETTSWTAAIDNGPAGVAYYEIAVSTTTAEGGIVANGEWKNLGNIVSGSIDNGASAFLTGAVDYYTLVRSYDNAGNISPIITAVGPWQVVALSPEQITSMSVVNATDSSLRVGWPYPTDHGLPITDYIIQYKLASDQAWTTINDGVSTSRRYTQIGLEDETNYHFRVRAYNGTNFGAWSPILTAETLPTIDFVSTPYAAINVGGATFNQLVSLEDDNEIYYGDNLASTYNDGSAISLDLDRGRTISVPADDFTIVTATKPFFIAGRLGAGGDTSKANVVWQTSSWIGKDFLFSHNRSNPMKVKVYAFTPSTVTITRNGAAVAGGIVTITAEAGHIFTISTIGSYEISSTGFIAVYGYANSGGSQYVDPKPFLPSSNDLVGVPSRSAILSSRSAGNTYTAYHSDSMTGTGTVNAGAGAPLNSRGTRGTYQDQAVRIRSIAPIVANSYADSNGSCSSPLVPTAFQKTKFALNVQSEWVAMASTNTGTVTAYEPTADGLGWEAPKIYSLSRIGANNNTPTKAYEGADFRAGTIFEGTVPFQMWYEPKNDTNAADNDETIMFGWD